jgi:protein-tyrosine phosphatase
VTSDLQAMQTSEALRQPISKLHQEIKNTHETYQNAEITQEELEQKWDASFNKHRASIKEALTSLPMPDHAVIQHFKRIVARIKIGFEALRAGCSIPHSALIFMNKHSNIFHPDNQVLFSVVS